MHCSLLETFKNYYSYDKPTLETLSRHQEHLHMITYIHVLELHVSLKQS